MPRIAAFRLLSSSPRALVSIYRDVFGFSEIATGRLTLGPSVLEIGKARFAYPQDISGNDPRFQHCAIVVSDMQKAYKALASHNGWAPISLAGPERLPAASGGAEAFKFRDPDGHPLELICFSPERMPDLWKGRRALFLGIDHSAISTSDAARSLRFYDGLGFHVSSRQTNMGIEQGRLDGMTTGEATKVEVIGLELDGGGPHLELLSYATPVMRVEQPVADGSAAATCIAIESSERNAGKTPDPDGHRLELLPSGVRKPFI